MAQTEALMLIGLGFFSAIILVLAFGRGIWSAANRYAKRQREKDTPATILALQAERDRLKAEHALMARKLEIGKEQTNATTTTQQSEVSRNRGRLISLTEEINDTKTRLVDKTIEAEKLSSDIEDLNATLTARDEIISDLQNALEDKTAEAASLVESLAMAANDLTETKSRFKGLTSDLAAKSFELEQTRLQSQSQISELRDPFKVSVSDTLPNPRREFTETRKASNVDFGFEREQLLDDDIDEPKNNLPVADNEEQISSPSFARPNRFNFDRQATIRRNSVTPVNDEQLEVRGIIEQARRGLIARSENSKTGKNTLDPAKPSAVENVVALAQRLRAVQQKSDEKSAKKMK